MRNGVYHIGEHPEGISPLEAVNLYRDSLSLHERKEILRYEKLTIEKRFGVRNDPMTWNAICLALKFLNELCRNSRLLDLLE
ncbi:hypothetical protein Smp_129150 [Schistosoma mansoni]|uniref:hypothetical protein n=1 Tax=Schistosoma mansoni TaxID=6183 RepID=UPI0001A6312A|nr:hypothetical protein Smp_129150 [Schistosoma mansoni]|eukprot:XP_018651084.1 hypothetical protein Smp_129150 [Schistosoma mansoni]